MNELYYEPIGISSDTVGASVTFVNTFEPESSRNLFNMKFIIVFLLCSLLSSSLVTKIQHVSFYYFYM